MIFTKAAALVILLAATAASASDARQLRGIGSGESPRVDEGLFNPTKEQVDLIPDITEIKVLSSRHEHARIELDEKFNSVMDKLLRMGLVKSEEAAEVAAKMQMHTEARLELDQKQEEILKKAP